MKLKIALLTIALLVIHFTYADITMDEKKFPVSESNAKAGTDSMKINEAANLQLFQPEEESYINDIPFDTQKVSESYFANQKPEVKQELYINDIPFDTQSIFSRYRIKSLGKPTVESENYINDIPFSTNDIADRYYNPSGTTGSKALKPSDN